MLLREGCRLNVLLISTYELGRQPFGLASPAAWLRNAGFDVDCLDLSRDDLDESKVRQAGFIALYVPMHTATRLSVQVLPAIRRINPTAHLCFYGLYAPLNSARLRRVGAQTILGGEFEHELVLAAQRVAARHANATPRYEQPAQPLQRTEAVVSLDRLKFVVPDRHRLPDLARYARLEEPGGEQRIAGNTEASRGCKHLCRHCPVVPVYQGRFRIVPQEVALEDITRQVEMGAQHITFGDPDFFNGIRHAISIVTALHRAHPALSYDVTIKVEHLLKYCEHIRTLRDTGCAFVTTAVESFDDRMLARLEKGHTCADFLRVLDLFRKQGLALAPTFVAFTPWTTFASYGQFLSTIARLGLVESVAPVQLGIRLLIPEGSRLLGLDEVRSVVGAFSETQLFYPWTHPDPRVDTLYAEVQKGIREGLLKKESRAGIFSRVRALGCEDSEHRWPEVPLRIAPGAIPYLTEPWYCCAEPTENLSATSRASGEVI